MKKCLTKIILASIWVCLFFSLVSCGKSEYARDQEAKREAVYNEGYEVGFTEGEREGYSEGILDAQERFDECIQNISWDIEDEYGLYPEEAIEILANYADGEPYTEEEIDRAIWVVRQYYWDSYWAVKDIDNYRN